VFVVVCFAKCSVCGVLRVWGCLCGVFFVISVPRVCDWVLCLVS